MIIASKFWRRVPAISLHGYRLRDGTGTRLRVLARSDRGRWRESRTGGPSESSVVLSFDAVGISLMKRTAEPRLRSFTATSRLPCVSHLDNELVKLTRTMRGVSRWIPIITPV